jgi:hypothetical protein
MLATIEHQRKNDKGLMATAIKHLDKPTDIILINSCRLYLQIHLLSDIVSPEGTKIFPYAFTGLPDTDGTPLFWKISQSQLRWPNQSRPPPQAWNAWRKLLKKLTLKANPLLLRYPLGPIQNTTNNFRTWHAHPQVSVTTVTPEHPATQRPTWTTTTFQK